MGNRCSTTWENAPSIHLETDACLFGYGGYFNGRWFAGAWPPHILDMAQSENAISMPFLELLALVIAAGTFGHLWERKKIQFNCDCLPAVHAVRGQGSRNPRQMLLLRALTSIACLRGFDFRAEHIAGTTNVVADCLSRHGDCAQFRGLCPQAERKATKEVWPNLDALLPTLA
jgi:hypothetical protein